MIKKKTVLVLGAGASAPFGFPTGQGLKDRVCIQTLLLRDKIQLLETLGFHTDTITRFRRALLHSGRPSVDAFLESREDFLDIGKTAIAVTLLPYETTRRLFKDWAVKRTQVEPPKKGNWYDLLFGILSDGVPFEEFDKHKLYIITFNYDRSIEHYLLTSLKNSYNKTDEECGEKLHKIKIIHVHGSLGPLDWQLLSTGSSSVPYDSGLKPEIIKLAANNIKIIHEGTADTSEFVQARDILLNSQEQQVFFLGFGFHPTNMKRLEMEKIHQSSITTMGTSLRLSNQRKKQIMDLIPSLNEDEKRLVPEDVYTFLHDYVSLV